mmetsp:Transcript_18858/g.52983  ORF Transcript_18858/g.52983 Transcript_18858/m.52983 type:complete len:270 (-) Transcript_18858:624-1433(-)
MRLDRLVDSHHLTVKLQKHKGVRILFLHRRRHARQLSYELQSEHCLEDGRDTLRHARPRRQRQTEIGRGEAENLGVQVVIYPVGHHEDEVAGLTHVEVAAEIAKVGLVRHSLVRAQTSSRVRRIACLQTISRCEVKKCSESWRIGEGFAIPDGYEKEAIEGPAVRQGGVMEAVGERRLRGGGLRITLQRLVLLLRRGRPRFGQIRLVHGGLLEEGDKLELQLALYLRRTLLKQTPEPPLRTGRNRLRIVAGRHSPRPDTRNPQCSAVRH